MDSFRSIGKKAKNLSKRVRRFVSHDVSSDSVSDHELGIEPYNFDSDEEAIERLQLPPRARTPPQKQLEYAQRKRRRKDEIKQQALQQSADIQTRNERAVNQMIENINETLGTNVGNTDPLIRFAIRQIINAHGLTLKSIELMAKSGVLLSALRDAAVSRSVTTGIVISAAGQRTLDILRSTGQLVSSGAAALASRLPSMSAFPFFSRQNQNPPVLLQMPVARQAQLDQPRFSGFGEDASRQLAADALLAQYLSRNTYAERAALEGFANARNAVSAPASAPPPPPPPALDAEEDICTICMAGPGINDSGIDRGVLGYIVRDRSSVSGHPNKFHQSCLQECLQLDPRCPMCRAHDPLWGTQRLQRQGGGSRKTRSKPKSKTRRLRKSRNKSRKPRKSCKSRKPRSSSRRR